MTPWRLSRQVQEVPHGGRAAAPGVSPVRGVRADISAHRQGGDTARLVRVLFYCRPGAARPESGYASLWFLPVVPAEKPPRLRLGAPRTSHRTSYRLVPIHLHDVRVTERENCQRPKYALCCAFDLRFSFPRAARPFPSDTLAPQRVNPAGMTGRPEPVGARGGYSPGANPIGSTPKRGRKEG